MACLIHNHEDDSCLVQHKIKLPVSLVYNMSLLSSASSWKLHSWKTMTSQTSKQSFAMILPYQFWSHSDGKRTSNRENDAWFTPVHPLITENSILQLSPCRSTDTETETNSCMTLMKSLYYNHHWFLTFLSYKQMPLCECKTLEQITKNGRGSHLKYCWDSIVLL